MTSLTFNFTPDSNDESESEFDFDTSFDTSFLDADSVADNSFIYIVTDDEPKQQITVRFALEVTVSELEKTIAAIDSKDINLAKTIINDLLSGAKDLLETIGDDE